MNMAAFSTKRWKVTFMRGEGEIYVFADTEEMAKGEALGQYRRRRAEVNSTPMETLIQAVEFVD
jgi:hypothetical protein